MSPDTTEEAANFDRYKLPGFGLPLDFKPSQSKVGETTDFLFPNILENMDESASLPAVTLRELTMIKFMDQITDKPDWHKKVFDEVICAKWRQEMLSSTDIDMTEAMVDWCIKELQFRTKSFEKTGAITIFTGDVVKSDSAIPESVKLQLREAVKVLEDIPDDKKDWHPDSDEKVLDIAHPSLFPLIYGRSRILPNSLTTLEKFIGGGEVIPVPHRNTQMALPRLQLDSNDSGDEQPEGEVNVPRTNISSLNWWSKPYSLRFQWLPCDVDIDKAGAAKITSYINNLHPQKYAKLYSTIEDIITRCIPLWNMTLTPVLTEKVRYTRMVYRLVKYDAEEGDPPSREEGEDDDTYWDREAEWRRVTRAEHLIRPEPGPFMPPLIAGEDIPEVYKGNHGTANTNPNDVAEFKGFSHIPECWDVDLRFDYGHRGLQVIVKLANIELTPEKPEYNGGTWHVEGQVNEHICASAIYYYDSENITSSRLAFRQHVNQDYFQSGIWGYGQDEHEWLTEIFGCKNDEPTIQTLGSIETKEGRLITFPNIMQHRVLPFKLEDPTKPGHRKILALFLVDPHIRIISTANVPCQRRDWWAEAIQNDQQLMNGPSLPQELWDKIIEDVDFPLTLEEAKKLRKELMDERRIYAVKQNMEFKSETFSLCEH